MKSIAIWYKSTNNGDSDINTIEVHFNLWKIPSSIRGFNRFLDIGLKLENTNSIEQLSIFFPAILEKKNIIDIVGKFIQENNLVCAIFNENYKTVSQANSKFYKIYNSKDQYLFDIYQLDDIDLSIVNEYQGTILNIKPPKVNHKLYFRIRIDTTFCKTFITIQKPSNAFVQSAFSKIELTDFRVNDVRDLNKSLLELISQQKNLAISKVHFFYMISSNEEVMNSHAPFISCRYLEKDKWNRYIGSNSIQNDEAILAYHWKEKDVAHFNVLIKSKFESNNWATIFIYLVILGVLSITFNLLSAVIFETIKPYL